MVGMMREGVFNGTGNWSREGTFLGWVFKGERGLRIFI